jgi:hypothetical protein
MLVEIASPTAGLVGRWGLDEGAGAAVYGTAGTGIHGPIIGSEITDWSRAGCVFALVAVEPDRVSEIELRPVTPNPVRGAASFQFAIPRTAHVRLEILDVQGRRVTVLADGEHAPGRHEIPWNGRMERGTVANGIYFVRLTGLARDITQRFVVLSR